MGHHVSHRHAPDDLLSQRALTVCIRPIPAIELVSYAPRMSLSGTHYRVACTLYSKDGKRSAEVREFSNGETYLLESDWVEGTTFAVRHAGRLVGPFASPTAAEQFIVATPWFNGSE